MAGIVFLVSRNIFCRNTGNLIKKSDSDVNSDSLLNIHILAEKKGVFSPRKRITICKTRVQSVADVFVVKNADGGKLVFFFLLTYDMSL